VCRSLASLCCGMNGPDNPYMMLAESLSERGRSRRRCGHSVPLVLSQCRRVPLVTRSLSPQYPGNISRICVGYRNEVEVDCNGSIHLIDLEHYRGEPPTGRNGRDIGWWRHTRQKISSSEDGPESGEEANVLDGGGQCGAL
jgi:hypothetical protein